MRASAWPTVLATAVATLTLPGVADAALANLEVYDRTSGRTLPVYEHAGRLYVAGEPKHRYQLRIRNHTGGRVLAVVSVDGVNVVSGQTAAQEQSGYVIEPWASVDIEGWRKSMDDVASFYFTPLHDSYAARTGRPDNVGVIGVALFREAAPPCCVSQPWRERAIPDAPAPAAEAQSADSSVAERRSEGSSAKSESRLGTGHGERQSSPVRYTEFRRESSHPNETLVFYYDSARNLRAQGILPAPYRYANQRPNPFPNGFVPDP